MTDPLDQVKEYFTRRIAEHGASPRGVDWNSAEVQEKRFAQVLRVRDSDNAFSILDWGCGYGALYDYLVRQKTDFRYVGFDITPAVLDKARAAHVNTAASFVGELSSVPICDYAVACGVFNLKLEAKDDAWIDFIHAQLTDMLAHATRGVSATFLTNYSDPPKRRDDLFYADPLRLFDFAKRALSPHVSLLHDYGHWDFTLVVRKVAL